MTGESTLKTGRKMQHIKFGTTQNIVDHSASGFKMNSHKCKTLARFAKHPKLFSHRYSKVFRDRLYEGRRGFRALVKQRKRSTSPLRSHDTTKHHFDKNIVRLEFLLNSSECIDPEIFFIVMVREHPSDIVVIEPLA